MLSRMIERGGPITAWIIDDTGFPKKGKHSVGVARQYCGQLGKQDNCQVAVSLSIANEKASLPIAWRLYPADNWAHDLLAQFTAPGEQLRGDHAVPTRNGTDGLLVRVALRHNRDLDLRRPLPALPLAGEDL